MSTSAAANDSTSTAPASRWQQVGTDWVLVLSGDWRSLPEPHALPMQLPAVHGEGQPPACIAFDSDALGGWDAVLASQLWELTVQLRRRGFELRTEGLPAGLRAVLELAAPTGPPASPELHAGEPQAVRQASSATVPLSARSAGPAPGTASQAAITIAFFGEVLLAVLRWLRGRAVVPAADVLHQLDQTGPRSLPIVLLTCALLGLMLAYMGGAQLGRIGAQGFLADVVTVGMVRELAGLMTGIILAGRVGSAFAAQLATMQAGEEIDALRVLGVDPIAHLVLPRLLALLLMAPVLIGFGALAGIAAGWPAVVLAHGVTTPEYFQQCLRAITSTHLWIGLFKGMIYVTLVALAGCREGLHAGRSAQAVGAATTAAVVKALVWIVAAACLTTVVFTNLGF
jgi:phospholipid/cholesterol/gamma-HCH transport system permease protein